MEQSQVVRHGHGLLARVMKINLDIDGKLSPSMLGNCKGGSLYACNHDSQQNTSGLVLSIPTIIEGGYSILRTGSLKELCNWNTTFLTKYERSSSSGPRIYTVHLTDASQRRILDLRQRESCQMPPNCKRTCATSRLHPALAEAQLQRFHTQMVFPSVSPLFVDS